MPSTLIATGGALTADAAHADDRCVMVTVARAARTLGVSPDTLKRGGEAGEVPVKRVRSVYLVPVAWLTWMTAWSPETEVS